MTEKRISLPPHPGKTPAHRKALDALGCGDRPNMHPSTEKALVDAGLIVEIGQRVIVQDRFGTMTAPEYEMPIPVHYQWCQRMSAEYDALPDDEKAALEAPDTTPSHKGARYE